MIADINRILYGVLALFVLLSSTKDRNDRAYATLVTYIFLSTAGLFSLSFIPRDPHNDGALSILLYFLSDLIIFSWYFGHLVAWTRYRQLKQGTLLAALAAAGVGLLLAGSGLYRRAQFGPQGEYLGLLENSIRWTILHTLITLTVLVSLYHMARRILSRGVAPAHVLLMLSTLGCVIQLASTMKIGIIINLQLYWYGLFIYLATGIMIYGYRVARQRLLRPPLPPGGNRRDRRVETRQPA